MRDEMRMCKLLQWEEKSAFWLDLNALKILWFCRNLLIVVYMLLCKDILR